MCGKIHGTSENQDDRQSRTPGFACLPSFFPAHEKFMQSLICDACLAQAEPQERGVFDPFRTTSCEITVSKYNESRDE